MGYNNSGARRLVFDVETAPLEDAASYLEPVEAPANYKNPEAIAAYQTKAHAEQLAKCALDVDLCRVVAIGWQAEGDDVFALTVTRPEVMECDGGLPESLVLRMFWQRVADSHLVGFNCLGFDLPVLFRRSLYLGVPTPSIQIDRFKHPRVTDLMSLLSLDGRLRLRGLAFYCKRFGIEVNDPLKGAEVGQAVAEGRWDDVGAHVLADVKKTALLAEKMGLFMAAAKEAVL